MRHRFLRACRREPVDRTPVWLMRQTGRYLPEYRALRERHSLDQLCRTPELVAEATLLPLMRFDLDAALLFTDVALPLETLGLSLVRGEQDVLAPAAPLPPDAHLNRLTYRDPREVLPFLAESVRSTVAELGGHRPLLGQAAGPLTLASYALEGHDPRSFTRVRALMYGEPGRWHHLCDQLAGLIAEVLIIQIEAGAEAVQVFETWAGVLSEEDYRTFVLPHSRRIFNRIREAGVPAIHFGLGTGHLLRTLAGAGADVVGLDWRTPLDDAWDQVGTDRGVQGNLNPARLLGPVDDLLEAVEDVLARADGRPGHIFNLGHGLLPTTPPERVDLLVRHVHAVGGRAASDEG